MTDDRHLDPRYDARLSELISEAADSVEPGEGLTAIRSRTRKETPMSTRNSSSKNWLYAVGGAVVGTAAVIIAIAVVSQLNDDGGTHARPPGRPSPRRPTRPRTRPRPTRRRTPRRPRTLAVRPAHRGGRAGLLRRRRPPGHRAVPRVPAGHRRRPRRPGRPGRRGRPGPRPRLPLAVAGRHAGHRVVRRRRDHRRPHRRRPPRPPGRDDQARRRAGDPAGRLQRPGRGGRAGRRPAPARRPALRPGARQPGVRAAHQRQGHRCAVADEHQRPGGGRRPSPGRSRRPASTTPSRRPSPGRSASGGQVVAQRGRHGRRLRRGQALPPGRPRSTSPASRRAPTPSSP